jgi:hypothetical protein
VVDEEVRQHHLPMIALWSLRARQCFARALCSHRECHVKAGLLRSRSLVVMVMVCLHDASVGGVLRHRTCVYFRNGCAESITLLLTPEGRL